MLKRSSTDYDYQNVWAPFIIYWNCSMSRNWNFTKFCLRMYLKVKTQWNRVEFQISYLCHLYTCDWLSISSTPTYNSLNISNFTIPIKLQAQSTTNGSVTKYTYNMNSVQHVQNETSPRSVGDISLSNNFHIYIAPESAKPTLVLYLDIKWASLYFDL